MLNKLEKKFPLLDLPKDLLLLIFSYLSVQDTFNMRTNKQLRKFVENENLWNASKNPKIKLSFKQVLSNAKMFAPSKAYFSLIKQINKTASIANYVNLLSVIKHKNILYQFNQIQMNDLKWHLFFAKRNIIITATRPHVMQFVISIGGLLCAAGRIYFYLDYLYTHGSGPQKGYFSYPDYSPNGVFEFCSLKKYYNNDYYHLESEGGFCRELVQNYFPPVLNASFAVGTACGFFLKFVDGCVYPATSYLSRSLLPTLDMTENESLLRMASFNLLQHRDYIFLSIGMMFSLLLYNLAPQNYNGKDCLIDSSLEMECLMQEMTALNNTTLSLGIIESTMLAYSLYSVLALLFKGAKKMFASAKDCYQSHGLFRNDTQSIANQPALLLDENNELLEHVIGMDEEKNDEENEGLPLLKPF